MLSTSSCASHPQAFDLQCAGTRHRTASRSPPRDDTFATRLRVDPATREFCEDDCPAVYHLHVVTPSSLEYHFDDALADEDHAAHTRRPGNWNSMFAGDNKDDLVIDSTTGAMHRVEVFEAGDPASQHYESTSTGTCTVAPFSGFPRPPWQPPRWWPRWMPRP